MLLRILIPLMIAGLLALACGSSPMHELDVVPIPIDSNPAPIDTLDTLDGCDEAEQIAMWLSGELTAPWQLRERIRNDLHAIRTGWQDSVPETAIMFFPPWPTSYILVGVSATVYSEIMGGQYHDWDSLNSEYGLDSVGDGHCHSVACWLRLHFDGCQNSLRLASVYSNLRGFIYAEVSGWVGDWPMLLCHEVGDQMIYFFRNAWGDCPSGCIYSTLDIFTTLNGTITYHGHLGEAPLSEPWKTWFEEACDRYHSRDTWPSGGRPPDATRPVSRP